MHNYNGMLVMVVTVACYLMGKDRHLSLFMHADSNYQGRECPVFPDSSDPDRTPDLLQLLGDSCSGQHLWSEEEWSK